MLAVPHGDLLSLAGPRFVRLGCTNCTLAELQQNCAEMDEYHPCLCQELMGGGLLSRGKAKAAEAAKMAEDRGRQAAKFADEKAREAAKLAEEKAGQAKAAAADGSMLGAVTAAGGSVVSSLSAQKFAQRS